MDCLVCTSSFNLTTRAKIHCFSCDITVCKECVRTFLTKTCNGLPKCMNCNARYTMHFMVRHLNRSWVLQTYKETMSSVLTNIEMSKLPETQPYVEAEQERIRLTLQNRVFQREIEEMKKKIAKLYDAIHVNQFRMRGEPVPHRLVNEFVDGTNVVILDTRKKFIMSCPLEGCRGFLSTQYKCGTCQKNICSDCLVLKIDGHVCLESDKLSADMIKKETKPCPKCGTRIYKIDGCDQMYCTAQLNGQACSTAFSWNTGKIETGVIHNPHFYETQRNGINLRVVGDVQCGGMPDLSVIFRVLRNLDATLCSNLARIHRRLSEHIQYTANEARHRIQQHDANMRKLRVTYMMGNCTKEDFTFNIYKQEKEHQKNVDLYHIYEIVSISGIECFHGIQRDFPRMSMENWTIYLAESGMKFEFIHEHLAELHKIREYCNEQMKQVSITYHCSVHEKDDMFQDVYVKYNMNGEKKK
jgi:hypothetical protein